MRTWDSKVFFQYTVLRDDEEITYYFLENGKYDISMWQEGHYIVNDAKWRVFNNKAQFWLDSNKTWYDIGFFRKTTEDNEMIKALVEYCIDGALLD